MKKRLISVLALLLCLCMLAACGGETPGEGTTDTTTPTMGQNSDNNTPDPLPGEQEKKLELVKEGKSVTVILGFNSADEVFYKNEFEALGARVIVATADGSEGVKGFVTDAMDGLDYSYFYTCGPEPMLKAVYGKSSTCGQFSFEERMGCGFGACMGCSCHTVTGYKRICKDGPVLEKEEIVKWQ